MAKSRKDNKGRVLRSGEVFVESEKRYKYLYTDYLGKRHSISSRDLLKLREKETELKRDQLDGIDSYLSSHVTVNDVFDRYISIKTNIRRTTKQNYIYMYNKFVRDTFGNKAIGSIKYSDVRSFYNSLITKCGMQPNTAATVHSVLHPTFQMAVRDSIIRNNPSDGVMREINESVGKNKGIRHALTLAQQQAFMDFIHGHPVYDHWYNAFTVLLGTGCRCGEFIGLRWEDIDMEQKTISINHALVRVPRGKNDRRRRLGVSLPKTDAGIRVIPMLDIVYEVLQKEYEFQEEYGFCEAEIEGMTGFVFYNANGNPLCEQNINSAIKRIRATYNEQEELKAKKEKRKPVIIPHFSCHHLRHTFCTRYCEYENNVKVIQSVMGHANVRTTLDIYAEATIDKKQESMNSFSKAWNDKIMNKENV